MLCRILNQFIVHFLLRFRIFSGTWLPVKDIIKGTELGTVVKDLEPLTKYEVRVAAKTNAGPGGWEYRSAITIEKPGLPTNLS